MSVAIAALIARIAFPTLVVVGWERGDLGPRTTAVFVVLGLAAWIALPLLVPNGDAFVTSALAVLDIALVFVIFKGDVRIT